MICLIYLQVKGNTYTAYCDDRHYFEAFQILGIKRTNKVLIVALYFPYFTSVLQH